MDDSESVTIPLNPRDELSPSTPEGKDTKHLSKCFLLSDNVQDDLMNTKEGSSNKVQRGLQILSIVSGSGLNIFWLGPMAVIALSLKVVGAVNMRNCEGQHLIPIWMVVYGVLSLLHMIIGIVRAVTTHHPNSHSPGERRCASYVGSVFELLVSLGRFGWLIAGSVWVFRFYIHYISPACTDNPTSLDCQCDKVPLYLSFVAIIVLYLTDLVSFIALCWYYCCVYWTIVEAEKNHETEDSHS